METAAILFDLDDTLVVDEAAVEAALLATCIEVQNRHGLDSQSLARTVRHCARELWRAAPTLAYCRAIGISSAEGLWARFLGNDPQLRKLHAWAPIYRRDAWAGALAAHGNRDTRLAEQLAETFPAERRARHWTFPEVDTVLRELQGRYRLAVVTNGAPDLQREKLDATGLAPYFAIITVSGEVGIGKPDSRIFSHTLTRLGVNILSCCEIDVTCSAGKGCDCSATIVLGGSGSPSKLSVLRKATSAACSPGDNEMRRRSGGSVARSVMPPA